jgi:hypothetical protein
VSPAGPRASRAERGPAAALTAPDADQRHRRERRHGQRQARVGLAQERANVQADRHDGHAERGADASGHVHHPACRRRISCGDGRHDLGVVGRSVYAKAHAEQTEQRH